MWRVNRRSVRMMGRCWCCVWTRCTGSCDRRTRDAQTGTHAWQHRRGCLTYRHRHSTHVTSCDRRRSGIERIHWADLGVMMMMRCCGYHRSQSIHPREALATQRRRYLGCPVVVRAVRAIERVRIREWLGNETVQTGRAEARLEIRRGLRGGVHRVALFLPPFRSSVLEPDLEVEERSVPGDILCTYIHQCQFINHEYGISILFVSIGGIKNIHICLLQYFTLV